MIWPFNKKSSAGAGEKKSVGSGGPEKTPRMFYFAPNIDVDRIASRLNEKYVYYEFIRSESPEELVRAIEAAFPLEVLVEDCVLIENSKNVRAAEVMKLLQRIGSARYGSLPIVAALKDWTIQDCKDITNLEGQYFALKHPFEHTHNMLVFHRRYTDPHKPSKPEVCEHLKPLADKAFESGVPCSYSGPNFWGGPPTLHRPPYGKWLRFRCLFDQASVEKWLKGVEFQEWDARGCADAGFYCKWHDSAVMGDHPTFAKPEDLRIKGGRS